MEKAYRLPRKRDWLTHFLVILTSIPLKNDPRDPYLGNIISFFDDVLSTSRIKADIVYTLFCYLISYFANDAPFNKYKKGGNSVHPILLFDKIAVGRNRKNSVYDKH